MGPFGVLQIVADSIKLLTKEDWIPPFADKAVFVLAPAIIAVTTLLAFAVVPIAPGIGVVDLNIGLLFFLAMSSLGVYSIVLGGWASNNKYSLLGGFRAAAQMLSYEVFMGLSLMGVVMLAGSFNLRDIVACAGKSVVLHSADPRPRNFYRRRALPRRAGCLSICPKSENELVAGFHTEYSSMKFGLFFIGEYVGITLISAMIVTLFFGGWLGPLLPPLIWFLLKTFIVIGFFVLLRAALPRPRYDQLMAYGWKVMLPLTLVNLLITGAVVLSTA